MIATCSKNAYLKTGGTDVKSLESVALKKDTTIKNIYKSGR